MCWIDSIIWYIIYHIYYKYITLRSQSVCRFAEFDDEKTWPAWKTTRTWRNDLSKNHCGYKYWRLNIFFLLINWRDFQNSKFSFKYSHPIQFPILKKIKMSKFQLGSPSWVLARQNKKRKILKIKTVIHNDKTAVLRLGFDGN